MLAATILKTPSWSSEKLASPIEEAQILYRQESFVRELLVVRFLLQPLQEALALVRVSVQGIGTEALAFPAEHSQGCSWGKIE